MHSRIPRVFIVVLLMLAVQPCLAQTADQPKGITVTGQAEVNAKPDVAYVSLGVVTEGKEAVQVAQANARKTEAIITALTTKAGIAKSDIETQQYSVQPNYDYQKSPAALIGYRVSNIVRVTARDLTKVGAVIDAAMAAGANNVQGVQFDLRNRDQVKQKALVEALRSAETEAGVIAQTLGVKLGPVTAVTTGGYSPPRPFEFGMAKSAGVPTTPILPGDIETAATVTVVYAINYR